MTCLRWIGRSSSYGPVAKSACSARELPVRRITGRTVCRRTAALPGRNVSGLPTHDLTHAFSLTRRVNDLPHLSPRQIARWTLSFS